MQDVTTHLEMRKHPRAQLQLPARIRWRGPLGMRFEVTNTLDVCREGVLLRRFEACEPRSRVWIIFPYDADADAMVQPETPARIMRVEPGQGASHRVALRLESRARTSAIRPGEDRRRAPRISFAVPIFVRLRGTPWPEECMTQDISKDGVRFETLHIYGAGDHVLATLPWSEWSRRGEMGGRVVRVESIDASGIEPASVAIEWAKDETGGRHNGKARV